MQISRQQLFFGAFFAVLLLQQIPIVLIPFKWFETYFHELSHALMTLLTGGQVKHIELNLNGSGVCRSVGGYTFLIALSGYIGACLFAVWLASLARKAQQWVIHLLTALIFITLVFWVRDLISLLIIVFMLSVLYSVNLYLNTAWRRFIMLALAINMSLNALKSPFYLFNPANSGDATILANLTHIHEYVWIIIWISVGLGSLYWIWRGLYAKN